MDSLETAAQPSQNSKNVRLLLALKRTLEKESFILTALFIIILFYTLYFASPIIVPIVLALLFAYLLAPLIRYLKKLYIPPQLSAVLIIALTFFWIGYLFYGLSGPAAGWINKGPAMISQVSNKLSKLTKPLEKPMQNISNMTEKLSAPSNTTTITHPTILGVDTNRILGSLFSNTGEFFIQFTLMIMLLYFLISNEDFLLLKIIKMVPRLKDKKHVLIITRETETKIGIYLLQRVVINGALTIVISLLMYLFGMPNPILWGVMAGLLEFIPYVGVTVGTIIITLVSIITFDNFWQIIGIPIAFFTVCTIVGNFITPILLGRQFIISPIVVFLAVVFWGWMWGMIGAIIAVPMIIILKTIYENLFTDSIIGELLDE